MLDNKWQLCIIGITLKDGGDQIGEKGRVLFNRFTNQGIEESLQKNWTYSFRTYQKGY